MQDLNSSNSNNYYAKILETKKDDVTITIFFYNCFNSLVNVAGDYTVLVVQLTHFH